MLRSPCGLSALVLLAAFGCGGREEGRKPVYPVRGTVLVNDRPAARAHVILHPLDDPDPHAMRPHGDVGPDGRFQLTTYQSNDGAPAGQYAVTVVWPTPARSPDDEEGADRLRGRYSDPKRTTLKVQVEAQSNELDPFRLK